MKPFVWHYKRNSWVQVWFEGQMPGSVVRSWLVGEVLNIMEGPGTAQSELAKKARAW